MYLHIKCIEGQPGTTVRGHLVGGGPFPSKLEAFESNSFLTLINQKLQIP